MENTIPFDKRKSENVLAERVSPDVNMCKYLLDLCQISFHERFFKTDVIAVVNMDNKKINQLRMLPTLHPKNFGFSPLL